MHALPAPPKPSSAPQINHRAHIRSGIRRHVLIGLLSIATLVFGIGGLAAMIDFAGAVVGHGVLVVSGNVKKIQHQSGGTVSEILVKEGDKVKAGDVLIRLDPTMAAANRGIVTRGLYDALAQKVRLEAERSGATELVFPKDYVARAETDSMAAEAIRVETNAFEAGVAARSGLKDQLRKKINELEQQLVGLDAQKDALGRQIDLARSEVEGLRTLRGQDLVSTQRITEAEMRLAQLEGQLGQVVVGRATRPMVHIMELAHRGISGLLHLHEHQCRDRLDLVGRQAIDEAIHQVSPGPEAVASRRAILGHARHRALERMRVQIAQRRQQSIDPHIPRQRRRAGLDHGHEPVRELEPHIFCPTRSEQSLLCVDHDRAPPSDYNMSRHTRYTFIQDESNTFWPKGSA